MSDLIVFLERKLERLRVDISDGQSSISTRRKEIEELEAVISGRMANIAELESAIALLKAHSVAEAA